MPHNKWTLVLLILLFNCSYGQQSNAFKPLTTIIKTLEQRYNVKFSYAVEDVKDIAIESPQSSLSLSETLVYLNKKVLLNFRAIDDRYITVSLLNKTVTVCGTVYSKDLTTSLPGASVRIAQSTKSAITSDKGYFKIDNINLNAVLNISYIGYADQQFTVKDLLMNEQNCKKIILQTSNEELNQVLITKYFTTGLQKYLDGSTVLESKKFGILPGLVAPDILQSIQVLPGVESTNESIANINVRGGTNDQNLMLWDNIKMYHSGHFFGLISAYNPNVTRKVIVSKNGTSAAYSDGVSSTINMFTNDKVGTVVKGGLDVNLISTDAFIEIPVAKNLQIDLSARRSLTDFFKSPTYTNYFDRSFQDSEIKTTNQENNTSSDFYFYDYTAKLLFDINDKHHLRATVIGINNSLDYSELKTNNSSTEQKASRLAQNNAGYGGNWVANWSDRVNTEMSGYFSKYNIDASDYRVETDQRLTEANEVLETGLKLNLNYKINKHLTFLHGYQLTETGMLNQTTVRNPTFSSTIKNVLLTQALFSEAEYHKNSTYIRLGARLNYFQKFDKMIIEPRLNIRQQISDLLALKIEGEFKNQTSTQIIDFEDDFLGVEKRRWVLVDNKAIPIATSKQASLGIEFKRNQFNIDLTGFYKFVDGITASNQGFYNSFQYTTATGNYTAKGVEFLVNKSGKNYSMWCSYTFSTNNYEFESFTPSSFPNNADIRHSASLGLNYDLSPNFKISVGGIWRSGQPYTEPVAGNETKKNGSFTMVNYSSPNSKNLDDFMRIDTSLSYDFKFNSAVKATIRAGIINVTNQDNVISHYYKVDQNDQSKTIKIENKSLAMTPNINFRVNF
ncbi:carboxypeptidase-like regulatory domain-containing protein [Flavobacterium sp. F-380]|uniref:Carboxypeptidase-like regulatory domain-containing protein n=1 Tax=Flavobacterium kayseriense TaxID=2764714 RepID=A0ABR7J841_9FLAO|nr:TonB-dependent receptor [Flavobacterium kayseriense]MBC5841626.1 carboxypeptidase-like regulatory domain-containing protein [Flavobacterium kayseriense]MBC5848154.1 carboxypeptidase-like regulatory domain-containing protein [Flavobacterium kayseriense]MBU0942326.1 TonB-dependent receptor [Bacteroidota bacterium]